MAVEPKQGDEPLQEPPTQAAPPRSADPERARRDDVIKKRIEVLMEEYRQLSATYSKHSSFAYTIVPVLAVILGGILAYAGLGVDSQSAPGQKRVFIGLIACTGITLLVVFIGFSQVFVSRIGIALVDVERRVDERFREFGEIVDESSEPLLQSNRVLVGQGLSQYHGLKGYYAITVVVMFIVFVASGYLLTEDFYILFDKKWWGRVVGGGLAFILLVINFLVVLWSYQLEQKTKADAEGRR